MGVVESNWAPQAIRSGRRALDEIACLSIVRDWIWIEDVKRWALHLRVRIAVPESSLFPEQSEWYVLVDPEYPLGSIKVFPSNENCFSETYPHQLYNGPGARAALWRAGEICLNSQTRKYDRFEDEPFDEELRLRWHCLRAIEWLKEAANGRLVKEGDPFEVPQFQGTYQGTYTEPFVAYAEGPSSLERWQSIQELAGVVELLAPRKPKKLFVVNKFLSLSGRELLRYEWGNYIRQESDGQEVRRGIWIRTPSIPVLPPWQAPSSWGEFRKAFALQQMDLDPLLRRCLARIRDGNPHLCLIGFPTPEKFGGAHASLYWQAFALPTIARGKLPGFRDSEPSHWQYDCNMLFSDSKKINWVCSENWGVEQVSTRGKLSEALRSKRILLIGAGAIGSAVGELLVRGGVQKVVVLDSQDLAVGNLTRHTLTMDDAGNPKAVSLAARLNKLSPHAIVLGFKTEFPAGESEVRQQVDECEVIIDCTGSDEVIRRLDAYPWKGPKIFFSVAMGIDARRMFCFSQCGKFSSIEFFARIRPWLELERKENHDRELPREGIGCWNPVFPARADDVWLLVSGVFSVFDGLGSSNASNANFVVYERVIREGRTVGVKERTNVEPGTE